MYGAEPTTQEEMRRILDLVNQYQAAAKRMDGAPSLEAQEEATERGTKS